MTDRDLLAGFPQVELADLPGPIDGPLKRPRRRRKQPPHLAQIVIDDRLAAIEAKRRDQLTDTLAGQLRIGPQQPMDLVLERIELRRRRRPPIDRRRIRPQRPAHRVAIDPVAPRELLDRHAADEMLAAQLSPALHVQHPFLPASITVDQARVRTHPDDDASRGCIFNRQKGVSIQPAPTSRSADEGGDRTPHE